MTLLMKTISQRTFQLQNIARNHNFKQRWFVRHISTSKKAKDTVSLSMPESHSEPSDIVRSNALVDSREPNKPKTWVSYGFSDTDIVEDNTMIHIIAFLGITVVTVGSIFIFMYMPDFRMLDWHRREAYLELRRREREGLPLIDPDLVPQDTIELPSDEELGDAEIII